MEEQEYTTDFDSSSDIASPDASQNENSVESVVGGFNDSDTVESKPQYTELERAQHAFEKRLGKQQKKHSAEIAEWQNKYSALEERLQRLENPEAYREKTRDDFSTQEEWDDYRLENKLKSLAENARKAHAEEQQKYEQQLAAQKAIADNVVKEFSTPELQEEFARTINAAAANGLGDVLKTNPMIVDYLKHNPKGNRMLYELCKDVNKVKEVFSHPDAMSQMFALKMMERDLQPLVANNVQPKQNHVQPVGRPGAKPVRQADNWASKDWLREAIRR